MNVMNFAVVLVVMAQLAAMPAFAASTSSAQELEKRGLVASPFEACKGVAIVNSEKYQANKSYWDQVQADCKGKVVVQVMPETFWMKGLKDVAAMSFLEKVADRVVDKAEKIGLARLKALQACLDNPKSATSALNAIKDQFPKGLTCDSLVDDYLASVKKALPEARLHAAFIKQPHAENDFYAIKDGKFGQLLNESLDTSEKAMGMEILKRAPMDSLKGADDEAKVKAAFVQEMEKIKKDMEAMGAQGPAVKKSFVNDRLAEVRKRHREEYLKVLTEVPQMSYLAKTKVLTRDDLKKVLPEMIQDTTKVRDELVAARKEGFNKDPKSTVANLLDFGYFQDEMEAVLKEENAKRENTSCPAAAAVLDELSKRTTARTAGVGAGFLALTFGGGMAGRGVTALAGRTAAGAMVGSFLGSAYTAAGIGFLGGAGLTYHDVKEGMKVGAQANAGVISQNQADEKVQAAKNALTMEVLGNDIPMLGTGAVLLNKGGKAVANMMIKGQLTKKIPPSDYEKLLKMSKAKDPETRKQAAQVIDDLTRAEVKRLLGRTPTEDDMKLLNELAGEGEGELAEKLVRALDKMKEGQRDNYVRDVQAVLAKVKSEKFKTPEQRLEIKDALITTAKDGDYDVAHTAMILDKWDGDAAAGWAKAALEADKQEGKTLVERFRNGLARMKYNKAYNKLTAAERAEVDAMGECGIGPKGKAIAAGTLEKMTPAELAALSSSCFKDDSQATL